MIISVKARNVYGQFKFYPAGALSATIAQTAGTVTISPQILKLWADMQAEVLIVEGDCAEVRKLLSDYNIDAT